MSTTLAMGGIAALVASTVLPYGIEVREGKRTLWHAFAPLSEPGIARLVFAVVMVILFASRLAEEWRPPEPDRARWRRWLLALSWVAALLSPMDGADCFSRAVPLAGFYLFWSALATLTVVTLRPRFWRRPPQVPTLE